MVLSVLVVGTAQPAEAVHKGRVCKHFPGPDGDNVLGQNLWVCLSVDDHDFEDKIRPMAFATNSGNQDVVLHVSYVKLIRGSTDVRARGPFQRRVEGEEAIALTTSWVNHPVGTYHSRMRMWACWPEVRRCGGVVVWSSGKATY